MADSDGVTVSVRALFQLVEAAENGRFAADGVEKNVPSVGRQVKVPGGSERLGMEGCPAVDEKEIVLLDDLEGLVDLPLALGEARPHVIVHPDGEGHLG